MKVFTPEEMRNVDTFTISNRGVSEFSLMENAALAAFSIIQRLYPVKKSRIAILCGGGNNGGDGLALSRKLFSHKADVKIITAVPKEKYKNTALQNYLAAENYGIPVFNAISGKKLSELLKNSDLIVDALLGTGLHSAPRGLFREYIEIANSFCIPIISLDIPSGADGSNGSEPGSVMKADATISFGAPKWGNVLYPAAERNGALFYSRLSFSPQDLNNDQIQGEILFPDPPPKREITGHKGSFGKILTIGGAHSYFGAPAFSARAVLKSGAGYSFLAAPESITAAWAPHAPELVYLPQKENSRGNISLENKKKLLEVSENVKGLIIGPGLSRDKETISLVTELLNNTNKPVLLDGDGLAALNNKTLTRTQKDSPLVITPHKAEFSEIAGKSIETLQSGILENVRFEADRWNAILVFKGPHSLVVLPGGKIFVNLTGNSGMGTAGSGDVLCGIIMGLYGQGMQLEEAVKAGVFLHGLAGDVASENMGTAAVTASDILTSVPEAHSLWEKKEFKLPLEQIL